MICDDSDIEVRYTWNETETCEAKHQCVEFMLEVLSTDQRRYNLASVEELPEFMSRPEASEFVMLYQSGRLTGILRMHLNHDMTVYAGLHSEIKQAVSQNQLFVDLGAYLIPDVSLSVRIRLLARLIGSAKKELQVRQISNLYAQVPQRHLRYWLEFGFSQAGEEFSLSGWRGNWTPIWVNNWNFKSRDTQSGSEFIGEYLSSIENK